MKIGFQSSAYDGLSLLQELKFAKEKNVDFFDVFFDGFMANDISPEEYLIINEWKKEGGDFTVHLPIAIDKCTEAELSSLSEFVKLVQPATATVHFDKLTWALLEKLFQLFGKHTKLCIENTIPDNNPFYNADYLTFMKTACKKYGVYSTFDTGHCNVNLTSKNQKSSGNIAMLARELLENGIQIATVHNHDNFGNKDAHSTVGSGNIDFAEFYNVLKSAGQNPMLIIEHWTGNEESLQALKKVII